MRIVRRAAFTPVPWRNGGGVTHEVLRVPGAAPAAAAVSAAGDPAAGVVASAEPFRWRVSVADIASSGPFSDFSGYHRTLVLLRGAGVRLCIGAGGERVLRHAGELVEFDGGCPTSSFLLDGACSDLNLMVSKSLPRPHAWVEPLTAAREWACTAGATLVFPITGTLSLVGREDASTLLGEWDLAVLQGDEVRRIRPAAAAACLVFFATLEDNLD